jgi:hypothetical protein
VLPLKQPVLELKQPVLALKQSVLEVKQPSLQLKQPVLQPEQSLLVLEQPFAPRMVHRCRCGGTEGVSANPYRTALATTVRRDAPDPLRRPFRYHNVGASPAGRYGSYLVGPFPPVSRSTLPSREGTVRGLERGRRPDVVVDERVS